MKYSWDPEKAKKNCQKHGVRFPDLEFVFEDERAIIIDEGFSDEERSIIIGMDALARILVVVYTKRGDELRIISARKAGSQERKQYGEK